MIRPHRFHGRHWRLAVALSLMQLLPAFWGGPVAAQSADMPAGSQRIIAIGDIHGALDSFELILRRAGLIDEQRAWIGGRDILVQTGDFFDRGADVKAVAELLQDLQKQAKRHGGQVVVLLGNHEALNLTMSLRDVTPEIVQPFAGKKSEKRRNRYCDRLFRRAKQKAGSNPPPDGAAFVQSCRQELPVGMLEYIEALAPDSSLGRWLRRLPVAAEVGGRLFLHGGLSPEWEHRSVDEINRQAWDELDRFDRLRKGLMIQDLIVQTSSLTEITGVARALHLVVKERGVEIENPPPALLEAVGSFETWVLFSPKGPLWFRGYANWDDDQLSTGVQPMLDELGIDGIVVGHTPRSSHLIESRMAGRILLIDTGMLTGVYGGQPAALEIVGDQLTAIYAESREPLQVSHCCPGSHGH